MLLITPILHSWEAFIPAENSLHHFYSPDSSYNIPCQYHTPSDLTPHWLKRETDTLILSFQTQRCRTCSVFYKKVLVFPNKFLQIAVLCCPFEAQLVGSFLGSLSTKQRAYSLLTGSTAKKIEQYGLPATSLFDQLVHQDADVCRLGHLCPDYPGEA
mmetsp:Transcript_76883/g.115701  ORF Transcript_76883/g.115701 Transcript_76883/m.115701 type:complete len:157 (-) Transcript_76883:1508-1978(-)